MIGFLNPNFSFKPKLDRLTGNMVLTPVDPKEENEIMEQAGFIIDRENGIYIREGYGAYKTGVDMSIKTMEDLRKYYDEMLKLNPYKEIIKLMDEEGYEFVLGPGAPSANGKVYTNGLYCKNYREILERQKANRKNEENWYIDNWDISR